MVFFTKFWNGLVSSGDVAKWQTALCPETVHHILLGISNSQLIGSHTMKRVCLKLKRDVLDLK